ncbi:hypothetical protein FQZ97_484380 [compost metagenome]
MAGLLGGQRVADGFTRQVVQVSLEDVLRGDHQGEAHHRVLGHLIHQGIDGVAFAGFPGEMAGGGWRPQAVDGEGAVGLAVEIPQAPGQVRAWLAEEQSLREVGAAGQLEFAWLRFIRVAGQRVEALSVVCRGAEQGRMRVEPAQQPGMDVGRSEAPAAHTGIGQPAAEPVTDPVEGVLGRVSAARGRRSDPAVDDQARAPRLSAPGQAGDRAVLEQPTGLGDGLQVVAEDAQVEFTEGGALGARLDVAAQFIQIQIPVGVVLCIELHDPGVVVQFIERVLQHVLQGVPHLQQPGRFAPFGTDRGQLEEGGHRLAVVQQHALGVGQVFHPGQQVGE